MSCMKSTLYYLEYLDNNIDEAVDTMKFLVV